MMARLTIEDCWWTDPRRFALGKLVGGEDQADLIAVRAWRVAQEFWKRGCTLVPKTLFEMIEHHADFVRAGLAELRGEGVYVKGSSAYLDWLNEAKKAGRLGGRVSAQRSRDKAGRLLPKQTQAASKQNPSDSNLLSPSLLLSPIQIQKKEGRGEKTSSAGALPHLAQIWNQNRGTLSEVRGCSGTRRRHAELRWRENTSTDYWAEIIARIARSPFCQGDNDRGWRADFDFLIRPDTRHKVEEGKYDHRAPVNVKAAADPELEAEMQEFARLRKDCIEGRL